MKIKEGLQRKLAIGILVLFFPLGIIGLVLWAWLKLGEMLGVIGEAP